MWTGSDVVRITGSGTGKVGMIALLLNDQDRYVAQEIMPWDLDMSHLAFSSMNLTLNTSIKIKSREKRAHVLVAIVLQAVTVVLAAYISYKWKWSGGGYEAPYGYPCYLAGSIMVILGMFASAYLVDSVTRDRIVSLNTILDRLSMRGVYLDGIRLDLTRIFMYQKECDIGDKHFPASLVHLLGPVHLSVHEPENQWP